MSELAFEFAASLFKVLQTQLPAMHLNSELIDLTDDFGALRFVFFQAALQVGQAREHFFGVGFIGCGSVRHRCWLFAR